KPSVKRRRCAGVFPSLLQKWVGANGPSVGRPIPQPDPTFRSGGQGPGAKCGIPCLLFPGPDAAILEGCCTSSSAQKTRSAEGDCDLFQRQWDSSGSVGRVGLTAF